MVTAATVATANVVVRKASATAARFPLDLRVLFVGAPKYGHRCRAQQDAIVPLERRFGRFRVSKLQRGAQELAIRIECNAAQVVAAVKFVHYVFLGHRDRELFEFQILGRRILLLFVATAVFSRRHVLVIFTHYQIVVFVVVASFILGFRLLRFLFVRRCSWLVRCHSFFVVAHQVHMINDVRGDCRRR
ncbi:Uncharacterized protein FWK35_00003918 [Aphis craccivora]|uniref:Uncharacterized protein n=1 Tax=Aphis craccivora TaxID=307492 RepID=A0A6G0YYD4_APHCR|nr:Uncharacterized protein FWK35_00003918 [Aphis craccivora]